MAEKKMSTTTQKVKRSAPSTDEEAGSNSSNSSKKNDKKAKVEVPVAEEPMETAVPKARPGQPLPVVSDDEIAATNTKDVRHEVAVPANYPFKPLMEYTAPEKPAREYPFILDPFQKWSIACIERGESVLVSAHTSAGKTVIAEYAIAISLQNKQRVIYTSPIKALSNQKYRELYEEFRDVGLMTGDVTINPTASCLVMTTEILRNMLYRGSEVMREVAWVVFDEIHYMRDKERGVVWEESIIMLPKTVHHVFLSATIPNAREFAEWICKVHEQPCHVIYTDYRPTPLQHYMFPAGGDGIYLVMDERSRLREDNFQKALSLVADTPIGKTGAKMRKGVGGKGPSDIYKIVKMIMERNYQPVIVFAFSKRECESLGQQMSKLDFNTDEEKSMVEAVFNNAIDSLSDDDKALPQIEAILPLLKQGIGIHHGGLLPILKEVIEILFQEGLIKALFATETFAMGLNMPARTVVFTSVRKFDGKDFRWVSSGEYTQMAGRAGRRGLDDRGIVIQMIDEKIDQTAARKMLTGGADNLTSAFHLSYNMILNLMRIEDISPEYLLERSFFQFQNNASVPSLEAQLAEMEAKRDEMTIENEKDIADIHQIKTQLARYNNDMRGVLNHPSFCLPFLQPGRLTRVREGALDFGWGCIVNFQKRLPSSKPNEIVPSDAQITRYVVDVLLYCSPQVADSTAAITTKGMVPAKEGEKGEMQVVPVMLTSLDGLSSIRVYIAKDLRPIENRQAVYKSIQEVKKRFPDGIPLLDPIADMGIEDEGFKKLSAKMDVLQGRLQQYNSIMTGDFSTVFAAYDAKLQLQNEIKALKKAIRQATAIMQMDELKCRKRVLRRLGYTTAADVIEMKGRVACEVSTGDELLLTEMIFNGVFGDLSVEQSVALLSCFVFDEKTEEQPRLRDELAGPLRQMQEAARRIARVSVESKLKVDEQEYVQTFRSEMMDITYQWCKGAKFSQVISMTDIFEGSIIRCIKRLEELLRQMCSAAKAIGNTELENKFAEGINLIKRDIIFAASLYL